jgi:hypothetical protein
MLMTAALAAFYSAQIVLRGAEFTNVHARQRRSDQEKTGAPSAGRRDLRAASAHTS